MGKNAIAKYKLNPFAQFGCLTKLQLLVQGLLDDPAAFGRSFQLGVALKDSQTGHSIGQGVALERTGRLVLLVQSQHLPAGYIRVQKRF